MSIKKIPNEQHIIIYYLSDLAEDDWYLYTALSKQLGHYLKVFAELRHIKDADGNYVTRANKNRYK